MKIGIDARFYQESGVGRYLRNLIDNLKILDKENQYYVFLLKKDFDSFKTTDNFEKILADYSWYGFAEQFKLPKLLNKFDLNLVHFPHFNVPVFYTGKFVVTVHDLIHQHFQMRRASTLNPLLYSIKYFGYKRVFKDAITKSQKIIVPSKYVSKILKAEWNVKQEKITVTLEAVDPGILSIAEKVTKVKMESVMNKFNIKPPYIFYVGNAHPHKNVEGLIRSFMDLKKKYQDLQLVLSGFDHYFWQRIKSEFQNKGIIFTGYVTDEELVALYKGAKSFILPSFEEGFGIPMLEAMACGAPVVCSNIGSLTEVGADAAIYFNPKNTNDISEKISKVLSDEKLSKNLTERGKKRYKNFSWRKMAEDTLKVYYQCI